MAEFVSQQSGRDYSTQMRFMEAQARAHPPEQDICQREECDMYKDAGKVEADYDIEEACAQAEGFDRVAYSHDLVGLLDGASFVALISIEP